jgi:hypothetical protein
MEIKNQKSKSIIYNLIFDPHEFWSMILGGNSGISFIGFSAIFATIIYLYIKYSILYAIIFTIILLIWIGPVLMYTPLLLLFAIGNTLSGNYDVPIGCGRASDGHLDCM